MASEADLKMEIAISRMLRAGVSIAAFVVLVGWILYLWQTHEVESDYLHFQPEHHPIGYSASDSDPDYACCFLRL